MPTAESAGIAVGGNDHGICFNGMLAGVNLKAARCLANGACLHTAKQSGPGGSGGVKHPFVQFAGMDRAGPFDDHAATVMIRRQMVVGLRRRNHLRTGISNVIQRVDLAGKLIPGLGRMRTDEAAAALINRVNLLVPNETLKPAIAVRCL